MDATLNNRFTLVVPTFNRYRYLLRLLRFYESYGFPFRILILDSSSTAAKSGALQSILDHEQVSCRKFESSLFIARKLAAGCLDIQTPFAAICADDDYLVPPAVTDCVDFLEKHSGYSCAQGVIIHHSPARNISARGFDWAPTYFRTGSNEFRRPSKRVQAYLDTQGRNGGQHYYAVYRTGILRTIWQETANHVSDHTLSELFAGGLTLVYGKRKILNNLYSSREPNDYRAFDRNYIKLGSTAEKIERAAAGLAKHITKVEKIPLHNAESLIEKCLRNRFAASVSSSASRSRKAVSELQSLFRKLKHSVLFKFYRRYYASLCEKPNARFYPDFERIKESVISANLGPEEIVAARKTYQAV